MDICDFRLTDFLNEITVSLRCVLFMACRKSCRISCEKSPYGEMLPEITHYYGECYRCEKSPYGEMLHSAHLCMLDM